MTQQMGVGETRSSLPFPDNNRPNGLFLYIYSSGDSCNPIQLFFFSANQVITF